MRPGPTVGPVDSEPDSFGCPGDVSVGRAGVGVGAVVVGVVAVVGVTAAVGPADGVPAAAAMRNPVPTLVSAAIMVAPIVNASHCDRLSTCQALLRCNGWTCTPAIRAVRPATNTVTPKHVSVARMA